MEFIKNYYDTKERMVQLENDMADVLKNWHEVISGHINYRHPEAVKNFNKLTNVEKKKVVLGIAFNFKPYHYLDAFDYVNFSKWRNDNDGITFNLKDYSGWGYIADKKSKKELNIFYKKILTEEVWRKSVINRHTTLGFNEWVNNFKLDSTEREEYFDYFCDIQDVFRLFSIKLPKYISNEYIVAFDKSKFEKEKPQDYFSSY